VLFPIHDKVFYLCQHASVEELAKTLQTDLHDLLEKVRFRRYPVDVLVVIDLADVVADVSVVLYS